MNILKKKFFLRENDLIQKTTFDLTTQEQKTIMYLISKIKPEDRNLREQEFQIQNFCKVCGIEKSQYSIGLYETLKSYEYKRSVKLNIEELKNQLKADVYKDF